MTIEEATPHVRMADIIHVVAAASDVAPEDLMPRGRCSARKRGQALRFIALCVWFFERPAVPSAILVGAERNSLLYHRERGLSEIAADPQARAAFKRIARDVVRRALRRRREQHAS
jgi:hypothetical protein